MPGRWAVMHVGRRHEEPSPGPSGCQASGSVTPPPGMLPPVGTGNDLDVGVGDTVVDQVGKPPHQGPSIVAAQAAHVTGADSLSVREPRTKGLRSPGWLVARPSAHRAGPCRPPTPGTCRCRHPPRCYPKYPQRVADVRRGRADGSRRRARGGRTVCEWVAATKAGPDA